MAKFILLIREDLSRYPIPKEELEALIQAHVKWAQQLTHRNIFVDGNGIASTGVLVEESGGQLVTAPLRDQREGVGGYYIIEAVDLEAAITVAKECPTFTYGDKVEVRPLGG
ncbi:MAG: YciI family protein [Chitinophagales bacterium]